MLWERVLAILAGWTIPPALVWTLACEILRFIRQADHHLIAHRNR
jgi:hypothetical protein